MMKVISRIYKWIIFSVIMQVLVLLFLDKYYLVKGVEIRATSYEINEEVKEEKGLQIKSGAQNIRVSFDGTYVAYLLEDKVEVLEIKSKKEKNVLGSENGKVDYFKWLPDRNTLIYSMNSKEGGNSHVQVMTMDLDSGLENSYPKIKGLSKESQVMSIELSPLTNMVYAKIKTSSSQAKIYKFDIMNNSNFIMNINPDSEIKETSYSDNFLYEDPKKNKVRVWEGGRWYSRDISGNEKVDLLGIDSEDNIFIGKIGEDGKIQKVLYGNLEKKALKEWTQVDLKEPVDAKDIIIAPSGKVFRLDETANEIVDIQTEKHIKFSGKYIEMLKDYVVSQDDGILKLTVIS